MPVDSSGSNWIAADWPANDSIIAGTTLRSAPGDTLPVPGEPSWLQQVHGSTVVEAGRFEYPPSADGSVSRDPALICVVRTADCLPVLFCSRDGAVRAAAHAGWRGLAAGVLENTVAKMGIASESVLAWMGPAISQPSFEVGGDVREAFVRQDDEAEAAFTVNDRGRWQADLYALARIRLNTVGVGAIYGGGECTFIDHERFFSYRRNPECGRMLSFIAQKNE